MLKLGFLILPETDLETVARLSKLVEKNGFNSSWTGDTAYQRDFIVTLTFMVKATEKIKVGIGVTNPYTRHPLKTALMVGTLSELSGGRIILGLGAGSIDALKSMGYEWIKPVKTCREAIEITRGMLSGEELSYNGEMIKVKKVKAWINFKGHVPIYIGCRRPLMLKLAGEAADGVLLDNAPIGYLDFAIERIKMGARISGRDLRNFEVANLVPFSVSKDREEARNKAKRFIPYDFISISELELKAAGLKPEDVEPIRIALARQLPEEFKRASSLISEKMIDEFSISGTPEECIRRMREYEKAGVTELVLVLPAEPHEEPEKIVKLTAKHILPEFI
ncbi:MAG: LLM class flavin-dependent oxidoreductase [Candidatus Bathyarchaeia archaeon]